MFSHMDQEKIPSDGDRKVTTIVTKVFSPQYEDFQWMIKDFKNFVNSPAHHLVQTFGPTRVDKLQFRLMLSQGTLKTEGHSTFYLHLLQEKDEKYDRNYAPGIFKVEVLLKELEEVNRFVMDFDRSSTHLIVLEDCQIDECSLKIRFGYWQNSIISSDNNLLDINRVDSEDVGRLSDFKQMFGNLPKIDKTSKSTMIGKEFKSMMLAKNSKLQTSNKKFIKFPKKARLMKSPKKYVSSIKPSKKSEDPNRWIIKGPFKSKNPTDGVQEAIRSMKLQEHPESDSDQSIEIVDDKQIDSFSSDNEAYSNIDVYNEHDKQEVSTSEICSNIDIYNEHDKQKINVLKFELRNLMDLLKEELIKYEIVHDRLLDKDKQIEELETQLKKMEMSEMHMRYQEVQKNKEDVQKEKIKEVMKMRKRMKMRKELKKMAVLKRKLKAFDGCVREFSFGTDKRSMSELKKKIDAIKVEVDEFGKPQFEPGPVCYARLELNVLYHQLITTFNSITSPRYKCVECRQPMKPQANGEASHLSCPIQQSKSKKKIFPVAYY